jgi:hypothetical protein
LREHDRGAFLACNVCCNTFSTIWISQNVGWALQYHILFNKLIFFWNGKYSVSILYSLGYAAPCCISWRSTNDSLWTVTCFAVRKYYWIACCFACLRDCVANICPFLSLLHAS